MKTQSGYHIYINKHSGTVQAMGEEALESIIQNSPLQVDSLLFLSPEDMFERLEKFQGEYPLLIGGGDGTIRSAAAMLVGKEHAFGLLPLGTMNLLGRDLGLPEHLEDVLAAYAGETIEKSIDAGMVNDEIFLCCAGLGMMPETSKFREENRGVIKPILIPQVTAYALKQLDPVNRKKMWLTLDKDRFRLKTPALVISNNTYGPQEEWSDVNFIRESLNDGLLGIYSVAPHSLWDKLRLVFKMRIGNWRKDKALREWQGKELKIKMRAKEVLLSLDGEPEIIKTPLAFKILPNALKLILPRIQKMNGENDE